MSRIHDLAQKQDMAIRKLEERRRLRRENGGGATQKSRTRPATPDRAVVLGSPFDGRSVRTGESPLTSRGYEFRRAALLLMGEIGPEDCRVELESAALIEKSLRYCPGYQRSAKRNGMVCPLVPMYLAGDADAPLMDRSTVNELTQKMWTGISGYDPDEAARYMQKYAGDGGGLTRKGWTPETAKVAASQLLPQQWNAQQYGGALVAPPEFGPMIPLLRNNNACLQAGVTVVPLPPQGRLVLPRQTTASIVYPVGEGQPGTQTNVQTDQFELSAKLIIGLFVVNNQLLKFGGPSIEQMFRNDLTESLGLQLDYYCLQGAGSNNVVAGLIGYPGVQNYALSTQPTPGGLGATGNTFQAVDVYNIRAKVYAANAQFTGWIMHPLMAGVISGARAGSGGGANTGPFLFDITRSYEEGVVVDRLALAKISQSTNCPTNRTKSTGTGLTTIYGGWWPNYYLGMYGSVEMAIAEQGTPYFSQYQTQIRGVLQADGGPRNPGAFIYYDQLTISTVS